MNKKRILFIGIITASVSAFSAFAASKLSGYGALSFGYIDSQSIGANGAISNDNRWGIMDASDVTLTFDLNETIKKKKGDGDMYGEISAFAKIGVRDMYYVDTASSWFYNPELRFMVGFKEAKFVFNEGENIYLSINGVMPQKRYAQGWETEYNGVVIGTTPTFAYSTALSTSYTTGSRYKTGVYTPTRYIEDPLRPYGGAMPGVTFNYKNYSLSLGGGKGVKTDGVLDNDKVALYALFNVDKLTFGTKYLDLNAQVGYYQGSLALGGDNAYGATTGALYDIFDAKELIFGFLFNCNTEEMKLRVGLNGNLNFVDNKNNRRNYNGSAPVGNNTYFTEKLQLEGSLNFSRKGDIPLYLDAWYLDNMALWATMAERKEYHMVYSNAYDDGFVYRNASGGFLGEGHGGNAASKGYDEVLHQALSARFKTVLLDKIRINVTAQDILNQGIYGAEVGYDLGGIIPTVGFNYTIDTNKIYTDGSWKRAAGVSANSIWEARPRLLFEHDLFKAEVSARVGKESFDGSKIYVNPYMCLEANNTIIDNCVLKLEWRHASFGGNSLSSVIDRSSTKVHGGNQAGSITLETRIGF